MIENNKRAGSLLATRFALVVRWLASVLFGIDLEPGRHLHPETRDHAEYAIRRAGSSYDRIMGALAKLRREISASRVQGSGLTAAAIGADSSAFIRIPSLSCQENFQARTLRCALQDVHATVRSTGARAGHKLMLSAA